MRRRSRAAVAVIWSLLLLMAITSGIIGGLFITYLRDLPTLEALEEYQPSLVTTLYSDHDEPFATLFEQKRFWTPLEKIPRDLINGLIAVEDAQFYQHRGINFRGIARALLVNLRALRPAEGGSSITQQLAKLLLLTPEKHLSRKIKEAILALEIEKRYSKEKILELYLNQVYFGHGAYGVESAAHTYFKKPVDQLNLAEAATLAGLPRAPNYYSPITDKERAIGRRNHVLARMVDQGFITKQQSASSSTATFNEFSFEKSRNLGPYFVEYIRQQLEERYGTYAVYHGGLKVYTTLNIAAQRAAETALFEGLREIDKARGFRAPRIRSSPATIGGTAPLSYLIPKAGETLNATVTKVLPQSMTVQVGGYQGDIALDKVPWLDTTKPRQQLQTGMEVKVQVLGVNKRTKRLDLSLEQDPEIEGAFLAIDPRDGGITAMIGGYDFERSKFNRALQARRQPGSAFKPFIYAAAFDRGLTPSTIINDAPVSYPILVDGKRTGWSPDNYDRKFRGPTTLRYGLEHSVNVVAVKLIERIGVDPVIELASSLGIESALRREYALALGVSEVTLSEMVSAFGVFAHSGIQFLPYGIRKVVDNKEALLEEYTPVGRQVMKAETAFVLTNVLQGVVERGTGSRARMLGRPIAGKTGTTQAATDAWFIGYTPTLVAGVWLGYDTKRSLGPHESAATLAVPIWTRFMQRALKDSPPEEFPIPDNVAPVLVNYPSGRPTTPDDKDAIKEFFFR
ncbi:penicillin-binding protein 1A [Candidatus Methylomirabilis lanthanidiphila]|uniref:peptidoglycan glycosyltransferase n=1 Tax=Candidatus Methylomirabilis lanthanidiphila TaxID=2211376 RepID=A0A564ZFV5_9BACT|nr:PBP1A family penicillin-binding protein [Candidatus Methylomirabilis lanthanidiphila]VUZ84231.1 penicillin-binding protein 1A [Candidatus Methylomirabilis lanthanidiphila]